MIEDATKRLVATARQQQLAGRIPVSATAGGQGL
jgi:hypothetical protein